MKLHAKFLAVNYHCFEQQQHWNILFQIKTFFFISTFLKILKPKAKVVLDSVGDRKFGSTKVLS